MKRSLDAILAMGFALVFGVGFVLAASGAAREKKDSVFIDAGVVAAAFAKGAPLYETGEYKIHASRRDKPGQAEIHSRDTDIVYVLEGKATFVTGGSIVGAQTIAANEIRGTGIDGGDVRQLMPGEVAIVPQGTPHWFKEVEGPFLYYVVKVTGPEMESSQR